ncbi:hypothetical protein J31TS6_57330 [Brevibacillus reuszeri]|uniref:hypothetical protein n=1 Tax=Brevibacillus reuszeri TaxID=54915 RepID=UPI001B0AA432|nr:hypothetical protein [Brevibacillus reuszeri]GIO09705.1 hypothetical protein J31TS6_57330 [Brevibacillus reuszeri]
MLKADFQAAYEHHLRLVGLFLTPGMRDEARWWLDYELSELEQDMKACGLL